MHTISKTKVGAFRWTFRIRRLRRFSTKRNAVNPKTSWIALQCFVWRRCSDTHLTDPSVSFGLSARRSNIGGVRPCARGRDGKELIQCPTISCDGMGHVSGNYATHRRQASYLVASSLLTPIKNEHTRAHTITCDRVVVDCARATALETTSGTNCSTFQARTWPTFWLDVTPLTLAKSKMRDSSGYSKDGAIFNN